MSAFDLTAFAVILAAETKAHVRQAISAAMTDVDVRLKAIDTLAHARGDAGPPGVAGPAGRDGKDADVVQVKAEIAAAMQAISGDLSAMMRDLVREEVGRQMAGVQMPRDGRDGKDVDLLAVKALVDAAVVTAVEPRPDVAGLVAAEVTKAIATWPRPTDGQDGAPGAKGPDGVAGSDGRDGIDGKDGAPGAVGPRGEPGAAGLPGMQGAKGDPGERGLMGEKGLDGVQGRDGRDGLPGVPGAQGEKGLDGLHGKDGLNGTNGADGLHGKDGLGFDDLSFGFTEQQGLLLRFARGEQVKESPLPVPWYAGVWQYGRVYPIAAMTTVKGAMWIAERHAPGRPGDPDSGWRLCVKAGQDGKPGPPGRDGHGE